MIDSNLTHLALVLDRSGSMAADGKALEAEKGVRSLVDEQKALPGRLEVTVARFDDHYELVALAHAPEALTPSDLTIGPRGMTALYDAVGRTVARIGDELAKRDEADRPGRVVVVVATDGLENASHEYTAVSLRKVIEEQTNAYGWEFMFMGTSQEAMLQAVAAGFSASTSYATMDSAAGISSSYTVASSTITRARTSGGKLHVSEEDRSKLA